MSELAQFKEWQCHKRVRGGQIVAMSELFHVPGHKLTIAGKDGEFTINVDSKWVDRHSARVGGYYVVYEDGYASYSPQAAFEGGYTLINQGAST